MNYAFWNIFGRPEVKPRFATGYPYTWWIDQDKLAKVESGASIPIERAGLD
jgi:microcin C transport system substrate-binding protein